MLRIFRGERRSDPAQPPSDAEQSPDGSGQGDAPPASTVAERPESASPAANGNASQSSTVETAQQTTVPGEAPPQQGAIESPQQGAVPGEAPPQQGALESPQQGAVPGEAPPSQLPADPGFLQRGRLRRRARFLRAARELAYRDLGGLVFDLHRFGQRNDEVVVAKLETLRRIDEELRALEDALKERSPITVLREVGVAACPRCAAIHGSGDRFCPACGMPVAPSERPIGGAPAQPPASPAIPQHPLTPQQPIHAYQPPPAPPITQPHVAAPAFPPSGPATSQLQPSPPQAPLPLPNAAAPAPAQQIGNGAYPALPAAPAAPTASQTPSPAPSPAPARSAPESPTEVLSGHEQSTRAFEPVPPTPDDHERSRDEERGER